ncbi:hypothetical protein BSKO_04005 [Bryopsis sp. KO-2023]|nr:hypothetical protein BSKO_04005 [Bryopsis sp. KO-2023]
MLWLRSGGKSLLFPHSRCRQRAPLSSRLKECRAQRICAVAGGGATTPQTGNNSRGQPGVPLQQRVLAGFLKLSSTPYSSYIPAPETFLHKVDARIKQAGIILVLFLLPGGGASKQAFIAGVVLLLTLVNLPRRTSLAQLGPLLGMTLIYFVLTCFFADGAAPVTLSHVPPADVQGLPPLTTPQAYKYSYFKFWFLNVTRKSVRIAVSAACLVFVALQSASLCLVTTPPEELAMSVQWFLTPLRFLGLPVKEIGFTLLMSLRFLSVVFSEVRNLALGIAVRGLDWAALGGLGTFRVLTSTVSQLFVKLFRTCENVALAMRMRGFVGPEEHRLYLLGSKQFHWVENFLAIGFLTGISFVALKL